MMMMKWLIIIPMKGIKSEVVCIILMIMMMVVIILMVVVVVVVMVVMMKMKIVEAQTAEVRSRWLTSDQKPTEPNYPDDYRDYHGIMIRDNYHDYHDAGDEDVFNQYNHGTSQSVKMITDFCCWLCWWQPPGGLLQAYL